MFTTRYPWGGTTVLLCALLLQNCQSSSLRATEEEALKETLLQARCQPPASDTLTQPLSCALSLPPTKATHQPTAPSLQLPPGTSLPAASASIRSTAGIAYSPDIPTQDAYRPFTASTGELVLFQQSGSQWQAVVQDGSSAYTTQRTLPVVGPADIGGFLLWLQGQDKWTSRARIHFLKMPQAPYSPCVYLGRVGLLGGMQQNTRDGEEDRKPPAQLTPAQDSSALEPGERWITLPTITLTSGQKHAPRVYDIPKGLRYITCRLKEGSVVQRANCIITYVAGPSRRSYKDIVENKNDRDFKAALEANGLGVVELGELGVNVEDHRLQEAHKETVESYDYAAIVFDISTENNWPFREDSKINITVEVLVEKIPATESHSSGVTSPSSLPPAAVAEGQGGSNKRKPALSTSASGARRGKGGEKEITQEGVAQSVQVGDVCSNATGSIAVGYSTGPISIVNNNSLTDEKKK